MDIPEITLVNVLARFPLKSIARFRLVTKEWKLLIDSDFFRDYYISFNSSSSISWSIIQTKPHKLTLEVVGHHGCKSLGLSQSPGSLVSFFAKTTISKLLVLACTDGLVSICAETSNGSPMYYIGNPLFQEWFRVPLPHFLSLQDLESLRKNNERFCDTGLVTKMQNCVVVSYKIVWMVRSTLFSNKLEFMVYFSETGMWETEHVYCTSLCPTIWSRYDKSIALSGILHWLSQDNVTYDASSIVAYDFYEGHNDDNECRVIHFPSKDDELRRFRRTFTTSEGYIVYFNEFENRGLRVWRLVKYTNDPEAWQLCWELKLESFIESGIDYFPVVMHPLKSEIIYLWSMKKKGLILFNLRTHLFSFHKETEVDSKCMDGCVLSFNGCKEYMEEIYRYYLQMYQCLPSHLFFSQYLLPRWLHRLPRPQPT
ncbi:putative F-box protein [Cardamine amara subsp. amara]|uniref:F-box protein n=1 Tax=Cardamine amara subsp. amara TaxID=228776 RepID=A0ABD0Z7B2_CARAN